MKKYNRCLICHMQDAYMNRDSLDDSGFCPFLITDCIDQRNGHLVDLYLERDDVCVDSEFDHSTLYEDKARVAVAAVSAPTFTVTQPISPIYEGHKPTIYEAIHLASIRLAIEFCHQHFGPFDQWYPILGKNQEAIRKARSLFAKAGLSRLVNATSSKPTRLKPNKNIDQSQEHKQFTYPIPDYMFFDIPSDLETPYISRSFSFTDLPPYYIWNNEIEKINELISIRL